MTPVSLTEEKLVDIYIVHTALGLFLTLLNHSDLTFGFVV